MNRLIAVCCGVSLLAGILILGGCAEAPDDEQAPAAAVAAVPAHVPAAMQACYACHADVVERYLEHGMSRSLGPAVAVDTGAVVNPRTGVRYVLEQTDAGTVLTGTAPDGGRRIQRVVGRIGAGNFDTSWATAEVDGFTGQTLNRLFFAPVETVADHGLELSPFELAAPSAGLNMALTNGCLTCHTDTPLARLPGAAVDANGQTLYPGHALGANAFSTLSPLTCEACHGEGPDHVALMEGLVGDAANTRDFVDLYSLSAGTQRDVCARCHLQGDVRFELTRTRPSLAHPLAGQIPTLVPERAQEDYRFVAQVDRLVNSACFKESPSMTCTTCHDPHTGVQAQGPASFDAACIGCHADVQPSHAPGPVEAVTGRPARTETGCVDCHVRKSQPFDLPHILTADHNIRKRIPKATFPAHRAWADSTGPMRLFDDGRLAPYLAKPGGKTWADGAQAMGLAAMGRVAAAADLFATFPPPGTPAARQATAPEGLVPLETDPEFHHMRALTLMAAQDLNGALAAYTDALALDPQRAGLRAERAQLYLLKGDMRSALFECDTLLAIQPNAEQAWNIRGAIAIRQGFGKLAIEAFERSTQIWPVDANPWRQLDLLYQSAGRPAQARQARQRAEALQPTPRAER